MLQLLTLDQSQLEASIKERDEIGRVELAVKKAEEKAKLETKIEEKTAMAKLMKAENEPISKIIKYTGLTEDEITNL